jgi:hypothetical protein
VVGHGERELQTGDHESVFQNLPPEYGKSCHSMITPHHPTCAPMARTNTAVLARRFR